MGNMILFDRGVATLCKDYFKGTDLSIYFSERGSGSSASVHKILEDQEFVVKKTRRKGDITVGEASHIIVERKNLRTYMRYHSVDWHGGEKQYSGECERIPLEVSNNDDWFRFLLDPESRTCCVGLYLRLPEKFYLKKQPPSQS